MLRTLAACSLALLLLCGFRANLEGEYEGVGTPAPDVTLADLDGKPRHLNEGAGGWVLYKFGTTWCPRCGDETEALNKLTPDLQKMGIRVMEVFLRETPEVVRGEVRARPRTYRGTVLVDSQGATLPVYGLSVIPRLFLVDPKGIVRLDSQYQEPDALRQALQKTLKAR